MYPTRRRARRTLPCAKTPHPSRQSRDTFPHREGIGAARILPCAKTPHPSRQSRDTFPHRGRQRAAKARTPRPLAVVRRAGVFIYGIVSAVLGIADFGMRGLYRGFAPRFMCGIFLQGFCAPQLFAYRFMHPALIRFYASLSVSGFFAGTSGFCAAFLRYDFYTGRYDNNSGSNCGTYGKCG